MTLLIERLIEHHDVCAVAIGGSRSRGTNTPDADYDLFVVVQDRVFNHWQEELGTFLERWSCGLVHHGFDEYKEGFGYIHLVLTDNEVYDLCLIGRSRIAEITPLHSNLLLLDRFGEYQRSAGTVANSVHDAESLFRREMPHIETRFINNLIRYIRARNSNDYPLMLRYVEHLKRELLPVYRFHSMQFGRVPSIPEKGPLDDTFLSSLRTRYMLDGTESTMDQTVVWMARVFLQYGTARDRALNVLERLGFL